MLLVVGFMLFVIFASLLLLLPVLWGREIRNQYAGSRAVTCPESGRPVAVTFDTTHAAMTGLTGRPDLQIADCTRWPARANCGQECLPEAVRQEPYTLGEVDVRTKQIYHLPVLIAAFASWYLGAVWHSHYLFRTRWTAALGLSPSELKQIVGWYSPHLLSVGVCLLFAYGVAFLLADRGRQGLWQGIVTSTLFWGAIAIIGVIGATQAGIAGELLRIELGYTFLASILVGALIGGLAGKLVLPPAEEKPGPATPEKGPLSPLNLEVNHTEAAASRSEGMHVS
jgi:Protein of unknown function (DUF1761)